VRQSFLVEALKRWSPRFFKMLPNNTELVVRQSPASKDANTESEETTALEAVTRRQQVKIQQTEDLVHAVVSALISYSAIVTCRYDMYVFIKSNYQSKPRL
jgi:hypothetical protein